MPNLASVLKEEIQRLARKEVRKENKSLQQATSRYRSDIAALKREVADLQRRLSFIEKQEKKRLEEETSGAAASSPASSSSSSDRAAESTARFSPDWLKKHREKIGFSAADYAKLVGVSPLSIYNWENGKTSPRAAQREALAAVRGIGKREAQQRLEMME